MRAKNVNADPGRSVRFFCPGCSSNHVVPVGQPQGWSFNGDLERPTLFPSVDVQSIYHCHSFVTDGRIRFLPDCTHALVGQTVDLPELLDKGESL